MTTSPPAVSVLIPAWNALASIERAIASVLEATDVDLECVVVDDASTDGTAELVGGIAANDSRVVLLRLAENAGVSVARNRGLERVRGEWLTLLDADDRFMPGGLATMARAAIESDARAVIGQQVWWDGRRQWLTRRYDIPDIRRPGRKSLADHPGLLNSVSPHAKLLHRSTWQGLEFSGRALGDQPWIIRALLRAGDGIEVLGATVYEWYRPGPASEGSSITTRTRGQVRRGVEAIGVASRALAEVESEARVQLGPRADALVTAYLARLVDVDLASHVTAALERRDPEMGALFDAIGSFVDGVQATQLAASASLPQSILTPVLRQWPDVPSGARNSFWRFIDRVRAMAPSPLDRGGFALRLAARAPGPGRDIVAPFLFRLARAARRLRRRRSGNA